MAKARMRGCGRSAGTLAVATILIAGDRLASAERRGREAGTAIALRELNRAGSTTRVQTELKAKGLYRPGLPPGGASGEAKMPKPLSVEIETRFIFHERIVEIDGQRDRPARQESAN